MVFKTDPYTNFSKGEIQIAKAIWIANKMEQFAPDRYKVSKEVEEVIGKIRFWKHEADKVISTTPGREGQVITLGSPYILLYKDSEG